MSDFTAIQEYVVENISRPVKYIIYKLTEFIRVVDKFVFRQVPTGAASGYATIEQIGGNTVAWNQLVQNGDFSDGTTGWSSPFSKAPLVSVTDNVLRVEKNATGGTGNWYQNTNQPTFYSTHIYYIALTMWNEDAETSIGFAFYNSNYGLGTNVIINTTSNVPQRYSILGSPQTTGNKFTLRVGSSATDVGKVGYFTNLVIHDLTAIFGSGNEPSTVADFEAWMAQNGLPSVADYNAGELLSVKMSGMQTQDSSQQTLDTLAFDVTTITGINTATNVREVIFPNGMKQANYAGTVKDTLDLRSDTATVKVGSVDLGDLTWQKYTYNDNYVFFATIENLMPYASNVTPKLINYRYPIAAATSLASGTSNTNAGKLMARATYSTIMINDSSYADTTTFKAAMNGVELVYELATSIEYTDLRDRYGNKLNGRYKVESGGTENILPQNTSTPISVAPIITTTYNKES